MKFSPRTRAQDRSAKTEANHSSFRQDLKVWNLLDSLIILRDKESMSKHILILGDILAILLVTLTGFASHGEMDLSLLPRMAAVFFPLNIAWFMLAPWLGLFQDDIIYNTRQFWRPALTALFAAPFAAVLRGFLLNAPIIPIFAAVLAATSALGMLVWRALYLLLERKAYQGH